MPEALDGEAVRKSHLIAWLRQFVHAGFCSSHCQPLAMSKACKAWGDHTLILRLLQLAQPRRDLRWVRLEETGVRPSFRAAFMAAVCCGCLVEAEGKGRQRVVSLARLDNDRLTGKLLNSRALENYFDNTILSTLVYRRVAGVHAWLTIGTTTTITTDVE